MKGRAEGNRDGAQAPAPQMSLLKAREPLPVQVLHPIVQPFENLRAHSTGGVGRAAGNGGTTVQERGCWSAI